MSESSSPPPAAEQRFFAIVAILVSMLAVYSVRSADADLWGHIRYGRHIWENGGRVGADPFAYTTAGHEWIDEEYLAQVVLWLVFDWAGVPGLLLYKCILGGATLFFLWRTLRLGTEDARIWGPLLAVLALGVGRWLLFRPYLFTFLIMAIFVDALFRHLLDRSARLWLLPPLLALWANLHGGCLAGIGAVGLAGLLRAWQSFQRHGFAVRAILRDTLPLSLTLVGCFLGSLVNPLGWRLWIYFVNELSFTGNREYIHEWQPIGSDWNMWPAYAPFFLFLAMLLVVSFSHLRERIADVPVWGWLLSCVPLTYFAFQSQRHIPIQMIWAAPVVGLLAGRKRFLTPFFVVVGLAGVLAFFTMNSVFHDPRPHIVVGAWSFGGKRPDRAAEFLRINELKGNLYTPLEYGGYLTWELYPSIRVSADGRNVTVFDRETVVDNFRFYTEKNPDLTIPWKHASDFLLIPTDMPGIAAVERDREWHELYADDDVVLYVRFTRYDDVLRKEWKQPEHTPRTTFP